VTRTAQFAAAAAVVLVCVWLGVGHFAADGISTAAFAQTVDRIESAKTIAWRQTRHAYFPHGDGKGTWVKTEEEHAYKAPGLYREVKVTVDERDPMKYVQITDTVRKKQLTLWPKQKADLKELATQGHDPRGAVQGGFRGDQERQLSVGWKAEDRERRSQRLPKR